MQLLLNALANIYLIRRAKNIAVTIDHSVTVLIPLRNEIENLNHLIDSLRFQRGIREIHFYVIDDNSTDGTKELAQQLIKDDARFTLISSRPLPHDWLGKPFALQQGFLKTKADVIVTIDADVRLQPYAIAQSVSLLYTLRFDFLSCYPKQIAITASERIIQPLLQWSWIATVPLRILASWRSQRCFGGKSWLYWNSASRRT
ncbi:MAG: glycosyltransferase family A protein [Actinomycetota bacterium]